ncbi:hypothetical protein BLNAU_16962 [Blattamonas nauphoetae]|uniref:Uncharacterized protein n=1 Tax=Blattamonas nauphoetae TaxID=2049346 RepID=A0ABQ9X9K6_9EUKA|nr:hypothetical protein BLNAU_16962 [Blattamonas nauphoetae]
MVVPCDERTQTIQAKIGGMIVRHFRSSIHLSQKEIGSIGIDLAAVRREMEEERIMIRQEREKEKREMEMREKEREITARKAEEERQKEFSKKMREIEEMKRMNERLIEKGRLQEEKENEERKREEERKRNEEDERRKDLKEGAAAIEVFQQDKFTLAGNVFTMTERYTYHHLLSHSFGAVVVRITFVIRTINEYFYFGLISTDLTEQIMTAQDWFMNMKGGAGWNCFINVRKPKQNDINSLTGSTCKAGAAGQRVVLEAYGREGKRTLKLSQDGETAPVFFTNIPVPFRFVILPYVAGNSVEIVSTEVLREVSIVGGSLEVVMD